MSAVARARTLRAGGALLVVLGVVHLCATPFIAALVRENARPQSADWLMRPMLLNHVLVGILLLPLGVLTFYAARAAAAGVAWALVVVRVSALTVASFVPTLVLLMGGRYIAPLFVLAIAIVLVVTVLLLVAAFGGGAAGDEV